MRHADLADERTERRAPEPSLPRRDLRCAKVLDLQRSAGNAAVSRLLAPPRTARVEHRIDMTAVIRRAEPPPDRAHAGAGRVSAIDHDAAPGNESHTVADPAVVTAALQAAAPEMDDTPLEEGQTLVLPDMQVPSKLLPPDTDGVGATFGYSGTVTESGTASPFGGTEWTIFKLTDVKIKRLADAWEVSFTLENPITYAIASGGNTDISDENDPALTNTNYKLAARDLTPDMSLLNGKPPRAQFWAKDLTERHERFHADERLRFAGAAAAQAQAWLNTQTALTEIQVRDLLVKIPGRVIGASETASGTAEAKESRAYGDGAPLYRARAQAIKARGDKGPTGGGYA